SMILRHTWTVSLGKSAPSHGLTYTRKFHSLKKLLSVHHPRSCYAIGVLLKGRGAIHCCVRMSGETVYRSHKYLYLLLTSQIRRKRRIVRINFLRRSQSGKCIPNVRSCRSLISRCGMMRIGRRHFILLTPEWPPYPFCALDLRIGMQLRKYLLAGEICLEP